MYLVLTLALHVMIELVYACKLAFFVKSFVDVPTTVTIDLGVVIARRINATPISVDAI